VLDYLIVGLLGGIVGLGELATRYRDRPLIALRAPGAYVYVSVNVAASIGALVLIRHYGWTFNLDGEAARTTRILIAGFGAMAVLRSALFVVRVADRDVPVGPGAFLSGLADVADGSIARSVQKKHLEHRMSLAQLCVGGVPFERVRVALPAYALALSANVSAEDQTELAKRVQALGASDMPESMKIALLGTLLIEVVGENVFEIAIQAFERDLKKDARPGVDAADGTRRPLREPSRPTVSTPPP
jgi:hypothetical protein